MPSRRTEKKPARSGRRRWDRRRVLLVALALAIVATFVVSALSPLITR